jgi:DNA-binding CsgD family transcriptional regulator
MSSSAILDGIYQGLLREGRLKQLESRLDELERGKRGEIKHLRLSNKAKDPLRGKKLTIKQVSWCLELARRQKVSLDWSVLTDEQEKCLRLRYQCGFNVELIARSLGKHRWTIYEHLARARAKLDHARNFEQRRKRHAMPKHGPTR